MNFITTTLFESLKTQIYMILGLHWFWNGVTGKNSVTATGYMGLALALMTTHDVVALLIIKALSLVLAEKVAKAA